MSVLLMGGTLSVCSAQGGLGDLVLDSIRPQGLDDSCPIDAGPIWCSKSTVGRKQACSPVSPVVCLPQRWGKVGSHIEHIASRFCLDTETIGDTHESVRELVINPCESTALSQRWDMVMS